MMSNEGIEDYRYCKEIPEDYDPRMVGVERGVQPLERETVITFDDAKDMAGISSGQVVVIRYLRQHWSLRLDEAMRQGKRIAGISGCLPRKCCFLTLKPRKHFHSGFRRRGPKEKRP